MKQTVSAQKASCCSGRQSKLDARISQHEIGGVYDSLAKIYDVWGYLTESRARDRALELAEIKNGQNILEVAAGTGLAFYEIVKSNPDGTNVGIDISDGMLKKAQKRLSKIGNSRYELQLGTAFNLEAEDNQCDLLINNYMFDLIPYDQMDAILTEFKRVIRKGGTLVLVNMTKGEKFGSGIYDFIYRISPKLMGGCRGVQLSERIRRHGFEVKTREYHQQLLFPSEVIIAQKRGCV
jgi:ubiquinone/menaquinone biosynthesis C-methylase UbiE